MLITFHDRIQNKRNTVKALFLHNRINQTIRSSRSFNYNINMKLYLIPIIILVFALPIAFADQVSPHMRCDITEQMTWNEELNVHECIGTSFVAPPTPACNKDIDYVWKQTGLQSYEQVLCNIPITQIEPTDFEFDAHVWDFWAWNFVFSDKYGW